MAPGMTVYSATATVLSENVQFSSLTTAVLATTFLTTATSMSLPMKAHK
jgi:hypothetical protein